MNWQYNISKILHRQHIDNIWTIQNNIWQIYRQCTDNVLFINRQSIVNMVYVWSIYSQYMILFIHHWPINILAYVIAVNKVNYRVLVYE